MFSVLKWRFRSGFLEAMDTVGRRQCQLELGTRYSSASHLKMKLMDKKLPSTRISIPRRISNRISQSQNPKISVVQDGSKLIVDDSYSMMNDIVSELEALAEEDYDSLPSLYDPVMSDSSMEMKMSGGNNNNSNSRGSKSSKKKTDNNKKTKVNLSKENREKSSKVKRDEREKLSREVGLNKSLVPFLEVCVFTKQLTKAVTCLNHYRQRHKLNSTFPRVTDVNAYNCILQGFSEQGNISRVRDIFQLIQEDGLKPSPQSYAAVFEVYGRHPISKHGTQSIRQFITSMEREGIELNDLFNKCIFVRDQREVLLSCIHRARPNFVPVIHPPPSDYICSLLTKLNVKDQLNNVVSPGEKLMTEEYALGLTEKQMKTELTGNVTVRSIAKKENLEHLDYYRTALEKTESKWQSAIEDALQRNLNALVSQTMKHKHQRSMSLFPFLNVLESKEYVRIIIQEIRRLAEGSETYSPSVTQLHREIGGQVLSRFQVLLKQENGILDKLNELYCEYIKWYMEPKKCITSRNSRHKWQELLYGLNSSGPHVDVEERMWPNSILGSIGRFLYNIILRDIKIDANVLKVNTQVEQVVPAFYSIYRMQGMHLKEEVKPHPALVKLFQAASRDELTFDANAVPMLCPPLPWASIRTGGYLLSAAKIVRLPFQAHQQQERLETCRTEDLYPSLDSLNQLGAVPWKINQKMLDIVMEVFNNKGDDRLGISPPPSECPVPPPIEPHMTKEQRFQIQKQRQALKRTKAEMYSLWCDALYRFSLANHFRNDIFWFPHNMDFRGRVYPCPPHLNHLGSDVARSILVFAKGQPLGPNGLDWLKIHLVNLTGLKKREPIRDRLKYANLLMDDILDSADNPLTGRKWWVTSDEPLQTLACCIEIADAIRSGDPENYVSHFPVHQDGSCNGLQHYAALGRDQAGAVSVNLAPADTPQDVYSAVATLVEKLRDRDAENGDAIAKVLEGFIQRKVIKQTVMTTVYGVTRYGARLQIAKQLKDIPHFNQEKLWAASLYLVRKTFDSLHAMFTSSREIQDWFTECATLISQVCGQNVEWVTPLGLPVVQPYIRISKRGPDSFDPFKLSETHTFDLFERPNVMKQKNAFPPNFIHSLDSSHMMLTSLHCERAGITFVSVHDCFWTHPRTVHIMNEICREQFVALHSQPILEDLSRFLVEKYSYAESEIEQDGSVIAETKIRLNHLLKQVPRKGAFDLTSVLSSVYFFS